MFDIQTNDTSNDEGVSPVIGVILMVAVTVILAAVIGAFVLDMAGNLQQSASASVQFEENSVDKDYNGNGEGDSGHVTAQVVSMQNADFVEVRVLLESGDIGIVHGSYSDIGGTSNVTSGSSKMVVDLGSVGKNVSFIYNDPSSGEASGTATIVGYLKGQGTILQTYDLGGPDK